MTRKMLMISNNLWMDRNSDTIQCGMALFLSRVSTPFRYLSRVLLTFMIMARRAEKNFRTVQGFSKGQARVRKQ